MTITVIVVVILIAIVVALARKRDVSQLFVGDENWDGTFACEAPEFAGPCYVYADGTEGSVRFNVPIVGYRAAPDLVVAVAFGYELTPAEAADFARRKHGKIPNTEELQRILKHWDTVNALKDVVEDLCLPEVFWVEVDGQLGIFSKRRQRVVREDRRFLGKVCAETLLIIER